MGSCPGPVCIRMGLIDGELCFVCVLSRHADGRPDRVSEVARVKKKERELLVTQTDPWVVLDASRVFLKEEHNPFKSALQAMNRAEQISSEFDNPLTYEKYNVLKRAEAERAAAARSKKNHARQAMKTSKQHNRRNKK